MMVSGPLLVLPIASPNTCFKRWTDITVDSDFIDATKSSHVCRGRVLFVGRGAGLSFLSAARFVPFHVGIASPPAALCVLFKVYASACVGLTGRHASNSVCGYVPACGSLLAGVGVGAGVDESSPGDVAAADCAAVAFVEFITAFPAVSAVPLLAQGTISLHPAMVHFGASCWCVSRVRGGLAAPGDALAALAAVGGVGVIAGLFTEMRRRRTWVVIATGWG